MIISRTQKIVIVDDQPLFCMTLKSVLEKYDEINILYYCHNGQELMDLLREAEEPDIIILDVSMAGKNGMDTAEWLQEHYPNIHVLILTEHDSEINQIRLLRYGVKGFLRKDCRPEDIRAATSVIAQGEFYHNQSTTARLIHLLKNDDPSHFLKTKCITDLELVFIKLACTELTYKGIAREMNLKPRAVDAIRDHLFIKLDVQSRVGLVMVAVRCGIVNCHEAALRRY